MYNYATLPMRSSSQRPDNRFAVATMIAATTLLANVQSQSPKR